MRDVDSQTHRCTEPINGIQGLRRKGEFLFNEYKVLVILNEYIVEICYIT